MSGIVPTKDRFCSYCGTAYVEPLVYPRTCSNAACKVTVWANPIPVSVVLVPVRAEPGVGLLVVRRGIPPGKGKLALTGGFLEEHERWQVGGAREVLEETGVQVDAAKLEPLWFTSTEPVPNRVLLFSVAPILERTALSAFKPSTESEERGLVFGPTGLEEVFAFPLHLQAARKWFDSQGLTGPHRFTPA
jgi:ADP-ribose pyrophosphatase YjhB (NUDIX family)